MNGSVIASFDRAASGYGACAPVQAAMAAWLAEWLPESREGRALEIGAGSGLFTEKILDWPGGVTATDISPAMCAVGRQFLPQAKWSVMAAESPLAGPWDWIFSSSMLQWVRAPEQVFSDWRGCLVPGGRMLAGVFVEGSLSELRSVCGGFAPLEWRSSDLWRGYLEQAGFRMIRDETALRMFAYDSARELLRTLHGVGAAPVRHFSAGQLRRVLREYETDFGRPEGGVRASWMFYRFEVERVT